MAKNSRGSPKEASGNSHPRRAMGDPYVPEEEKASGCCASVGNIQIPAWCVDASGTGDPYALEQLYKLCKACGGSAEVLIN